MADIEVTCPQCKQSLDCPEVLLGKSAKCPACKKIFEIPNPRHSVESGVPPILPGSHPPVGRYKSGSIHKGTSNRNVVKWVFIPFCGLVCLMIVSCIICAQIDSANEKKKNEERIKQSEVITKNAEQSIADGDIATAESLIVKACRLRRIAQADNNGKANQLKEQLRILKDEAVTHNNLLLLTDEEYIALGNKQLSKKIVSNEGINKLLIESMFNDLSSRPVLLEQRKIAEQIREQEIENEIEAVNAEYAARREGYAKEIRNYFLDSGLDIKVFVSGTDNKQLILKYALFNDVWMRKFSKSGTFEKWHKLGFNYIELRDGYNYSKSVSWHE